MILALNLNMSFTEALRLSTTEREMLLLLLERLRREAKDQLDKTGNE